MSRIFVSHSSRDNARAVALRDFLVGSGFDDLFLDLDPERGIAAGERWERRLHEAASRCEAVLFLVSRNWLASDWCLKEFHLAARLNKHIFGLLIEQIPLESLPRELTSTWQFIDLASGQDHEMLRVVVPPRHEEAHVTFSREGLTRLRLGLTKAGLDPRFFAWPPEDEPGREPYRGLKPLEAADAGIFFGREAPIVSALDRLRGLREAAAPRLFVIVGASGAGKSSFLRAGLLPRLARDDRHFIPLPVVRPERAAITGESGLLRSLEKALAGAGTPRTRADLRAAVASEGEQVRALLEALARRAQPPALPGESGQKPPAVLLPVDQAEELFLADGAAEAETLLGLLRGLAGTAAPDLIVLFTIRSDAYERLQTAQALEGLRQEVFSLPPLPGGAYQTVIEGPAVRLAGTRRALKIEPALTEALLADMEGGRGKDALPLLAFSLQRLYVEHGGDGDLRLDEYRALGGIEGSIDAAVGRALAAASADPRVPRDGTARLALLRRALIPWLAGIDPESKAPRRRVARYTEIPEEARPLVDHLTEARLLSKDVDLGTGVVTVEPAHEALLRQWGLLDGWLKEDFAALSILEGVRRASNEWLANARRPDWLAHAAGRLEDAERLRQRPDLAGLLAAEDWAYLDACRAAEDSRRDRELQEARRFAEEQGKAAEAQRLVVRRTRIGLLAASLLAVAAIGAALFGGMKAQEAEQQGAEARRQATEARSQADIALQQKTRADAERQAAQKNESRFYAASARRQAEAGNFSLARGLALAALPEEIGAEDSRPLVPEAVEALYAVTDADLEIGMLAEHTATASCLAFSPDGRRFATGDEAGMVRVWDAGTGALVARMQGGSDPVRGITFLPDSQHVISVSTDQTIRVWDAASGARQREIPLAAKNLWKVAISRDGRLVATTSENSAVAQLWDAGSGALRNELKGHDADVLSIAFSADGARIVTGSKDLSARVWSAADGREMLRLHGHEGGARLNGVVAVAFSTDGMRLVTGGTDRTARIWDATTGAPQAVLKDTGTTVMGPITAAAFSNDGRRVVTGSSDKVLRIWDSLSGKERTRLWTRESKSAVNAVAFTPDGGRIVASSYPGQLQWWQTSADDEVAQLDGSTGGTLLRRSPDGAWVAMALPDHSVGLWSMQSGKRLRTLKGHTAAIKVLAISDDGSRIAAGAADGTARVWDVLTGQMVFVFPGGHENLTQLRFPADGTRLLIGANDKELFGRKSVRVWNLSTGALDCDFQFKGSAIRSIALSADGTRAVLGFTQPIVLDTTSGQTISKLDHNDTFSPIVGFTKRQDVVFVVSASSVSYYERETGRKLNEIKNPDFGYLGGGKKYDETEIKQFLTRPDGPIVFWDMAADGAPAISDMRNARSPSVSSDGTRIVLPTGESQTVRDTRSGAVIRTIRWTGASAVFAPDGKTIVAQPHPELKDLPAKIWRAPPSLAEQLAVSRLALDRPLSPAERKSFGLPGPVSNRPAARSSKWEKTCETLAPNVTGAPRFDKILRDIGGGAVFGSSLLASGVFPWDAIAACEADIAAHPEQARLRFLLGRSQLQADHLPEAIQEFEAGKNLGDPLAYHALAILYRDGAGLPRDPSRALAHFAEALTRGHTAAAVNLGQMYWDGTGTAMDKPKALALWQRAASAGDGRAHERLAWVAELGRDGTAADLTKALYHYAVAVRLLEDSEDILESATARSRRSTLARLMEPEVVAGVWQDMRRFQKQSAAPQ